MMGTAGWASQIGVDGIDDGDDSDDAQQEDTRNTNYGAISYHTPRRPGAGGVGTGRMAVHNNSAVVVRKLQCKTAKSHRLSCQAQCPIGRSGVGPLTLERHSSLDLGGQCRYSDIVACSLSLFMFVAVEIIHVINITFPTNR
jgi:hypothetical protein